MARSGPLLGLVTDPTATADADATAHAAAEIANRQRLTQLGKVSLPLHAGIELFDVIELTYAPAALENALFRVIGVACRFERDSKRTRCESVLTLGSV